MLKKVWSYPVDFNVLGSELYLTILHRECYHTLRYMFVDKKIFESYFSDRLTLSNIRRIYRLALPLCAPETLSSLSTSHLTLFVRRMTSHNSIGSTLTWNGALPYQTSTESLLNWKEMQMGSSA